MTDSNVSSLPVLSLGYDSNISNAVFEGYWVVTAPASSGRTMITDSRLIDCDLHNTAWGNYSGCVFVGGRLPNEGQPGDANNCSVEAAAAAS